MSETIGTKEKRELEKAYFEEAKSWDEDKESRTFLSERRAWRVATAACVVGVLEALALVSIMPLKTVEPFVIRVDNNTGVTDVISVYAETDGEVEQDAQEVLDQYFLNQYILNREAYLWDSRDFTRQMVGLMSSTDVQQAYAAYTDPRTNPSAPVAIYGENTEVVVHPKSISFISSEKRPDKDGLTAVTALVRYTKQVKREGARSPLTHWAATITFIYIKTPLPLEDRLLNPLGFQVISYRNDQESIGG